MGLEGELAGRFASHDIDLSVLPHLTDADLEKIGLSLGHRRKILHAIASTGTARHDDPGRSPPADEAQPGVQQQLSVLCCRLADVNGLADRLFDVTERTCARSHAQHVQLTCGSVVRAYNGFSRGSARDGLIVFLAIQIPKKMMPNARCAPRWKSAPRWKCSNHRRMPAAHLTGADRNRERRRCARC